MGTTGIGPRVRGIGRIRARRLSKRLWVRSMAVLALASLALASTPLALADEVVDVFSLRSPALTGLRDPVEFADALAPVLPKPVVILTLDDAVARELVGSTRTMSQADALRTARTLIDEARSLHWDPLLFVAVRHGETA